MSSSPFLKLPRELRDEVYYYTFLTSPLIANPNKWFNNRDPAVVVSFSYTCGTTNFLQLFCVCKQISEESARLFFSSFLFLFSYYTSDKLITNVLDNVLLRGQTWVRHLGFLINLYVPCRGYGVADLVEKEEWQNEQKWCMNFSSLMKLLPSLTTEQGPKLDIGIWFNGGIDKPMIPDVKHLMVQQAMRCLGPLRGTKNLEIHCTSLREGFQGVVGEIRNEWTRNESRGEGEESKHIDFVNQRKNCWII